MLPECRFAWPDYRFARPEYRFAQPEYRFAQPDSWFASPGWRFAGPDRIKIGCFSVKRQLEGFLSGNVTVEVAIDEQGKVTSARPITGPAELRGPAEAAALKACFTPTKLSGMPFSVNRVITFSFVPQ